MKHEIIFEVIPHTKNASDSYTKKIIDRIATTINEIKGVSLLNIPEIVEENHIGLPYYRNIDSREFGLMLRQTCKKDIMVNTVVVHHNPKEIFEQWLDESISKYNIKNFVFVGSKINSIKYPGPSITEANFIARNKKINFGNIFIPERENEADRLIRKTASGCNFFTSQVIFEPENVIKILDEYSIKCAECNLKPAKVFLSFSPVSNLEDISFVKWLGAEIKEKTEQKLKSSQNIGDESIEIIIKALNEICDFIDRYKINIPLGLNIEYITLHNLELAKDFANKIIDLKLPVLISENYK